MAATLASSSQRDAFHDFAQAGHTHSLNTDSQADTAVMEAIAARIPRLRDADDPLKLTPLRAHYLKKTLVRLQVDREMQSLSRKGEQSAMCRE